MKPEPDIPVNAETQPSDKTDGLKTLAMPELLKKLGSSADGLSQAEAAKRLTQYGPNAITEKKSNPFLKFLTYFWGPIPWMIEAAVILSGVVRHWLDFGVISCCSVQTPSLDFGKSIKPATPLPLSSPSWRLRPAFFVTASGPTPMRRNSFRATLFVCSWALSYPPMRASCRAIRSKSMSPR